MCNIYTTETKAIAPMTKRPVDLSNLKTDQAEAIVRELTKASKMALSEHAKERMEERDIPWVTVV